ncbi:hypothetical protein BS47DRAFT_1300598 [Hydnum rufescens UP504]|uniref:Tc1-like transposase DDE domain-containing protein n=1 Tax=Hydnum rufescens UP504 TaxID=1448309 RepID=A0A9P6AQQ3_9AGAM|nr:hypothetical protein BS47DRAFT_1300598 [Hydnum rufescens UP504]
MCYEFLPQYSPHYNPIELSFSAIKAWICCNGETFQIAESDGTLIGLLHQAINTVSVEKEQAWFSWSGHGL